MGLRHALTALLALVALPARAAGTCLECHPAHHAAAGTCISCHRGDPRSRRPEIAHRDLISGRFAHHAVPGSPVTARGQQLVDAAGCRRCHVTGGRGRSAAADLDRLLPGARPEETLTAIQTPALFMPRFALSERAAVDVVNALLASSARAPPREGETPLVVLFEKTRQAEEGFATRCGGCHRMLTRAQGGLGTGNAGPNLSGLLGAFYPGTFKEGERWTSSSLKQWVKNPRGVRRWAAMPPVRLTDEEWARVRSAFDDEEPQR